MNLYTELFGVVLDAPRTIVDIIAIATNGFIGEELGRGGRLIFCYGDASVGDRVIINQSGLIIQSIEKLEWVEIIL